MRIHPTQCKNRLKTPFMALAGGAALCLSLALPAHATDLYGTSLEGNNLFKVNTSTMVVTTVFNTPTSADSLLFDTTGRIIYTELNTGEVRRYDPNTNTDVLLANGFNVPADMVLEPGGNSLLVSEFNGGKIDRINLITNAVTTLLSPGGNPEGLAYDPAGRLFANLGNRGGGATGKFIAQIDPVTGNILNTTTGLDSLDGLTFDPVTGHLFASSLYGNGIYEVDPNNLGSVSQHGFGTIPNPDGITSDAAGNLWIAARGNFTIYQYNVGTQAFAPNAFVNGLDDLAPASGLGSPVPEPGTFALLGAGAVCLAAARRRRRR